MMNRSSPFSTEIRWLAWLVILSQWVGWSCAFSRQGNSVARGTNLLAASDASIISNDELPADFPRRNDVLIALRAVRKACRVTNELQPGGNVSDAISTVEKGDLSPVTVADFACQASVLHDLHKAFPDDSFIAEESSAALDEDDELAKQVLAASALFNVDLVKESIDLGKDYLNWEQSGGRPRRVWCLDPIDGTRGYLRGKRQGGQYCIALALLEVSK